MQPDFSDRKEIFHSFGGVALDKCSSLKENEKKSVDIHSLLVSENSVILPYLDCKPLLQQNIDERSSCFLTYDEFLTIFGLDKQAAQLEFIFLGRILNGSFESKHAFVCNLPANTEISDNFAVTNVWNLMQHAGKLTNDDLTILGYGVNQLEFHKRHLFCGCCGHKTIMEGGGSRRKCPFCLGLVYPRTDPVVITLVVETITDSSCPRILLGRKPGWPPARWSALAGFVDHGESVESAVRREIKEESNIDVGRVRYHSSQPWPFPYQLMFGFIAEAKTVDITIDPELEDCRWFTRAEVKKLLDESKEHSRVLGAYNNAHCGVFESSSAQEASKNPNLPLHGPPIQTIAHWLMNSFAEEEPITRF
eukprot:GCRY01001198.1.p1 GENE.GCRY01001198.1~~GCRY01001198.1.p1  ORF type:complete len:364 (+),score=29.71 GCRY01001198.1:116-1207(+)